MEKNNGLKNKVIRGLAILGACAGIQVGATGCVTRYVDANGNVVSEHSNVGEVGHIWDKVNDTLEVGGRIALPIVDMSLRHHYRMNRPRYYYRPYRGR